MSSRLLRGWVAVQHEGCIYEIAASLGVSGHVSPEGLPVSSGASAEPSVVGGWGTARPSVWGRNRHPDSGSYVFMITTSFFW